MCARAWPPDEDFDDFDDEYGWDMQIEVDDDDECLHTDAFNDDWDDTTAF